MSLGRILFLLICGAILAIITVEPLKAAIRAGMERLHSLK